MFPPWRGGAIKGKGATWQFLPALALELAGKQIPPVLNLGGIDLYPSPALSDRLRLCPRGGKCRG